MAPPDLRSRPDTTLRTLLARARSWLGAPAPDRPLVVPAAPVDGRLSRLDRIRAALEEARATLAEGGWTGGAWFRVRQPDGGTRPASHAEARWLGLAAGSEAVAGACLVGALLRSAHDPDTGTTVADVWACVDELSETLHDRAGRSTRPPGWVQASAGRYDRLRAVTAWNDEPGRTQAQVLELLDRAVARTIVGACTP